jgi:cell cycle sensor histidine kinase DivJ
MFEMLAFGWLLCPIPAALLVSRAGPRESAQVLSSLALTGLVTAVAAATGGIASSAAILLVVVPIEAALSASRRVIVMTTMAALAAAGLLLVVGAQGLLPEPVGPARDAAALAGLGIISVALYATGVALAVAAFARDNSGLPHAEEDRYRLPAINMNDVITRHGRNGAVFLASPAAHTLFGVAPHELYGQRLFDRVHVADRPAYLTALVDAVTLGEVRSAEFRVRRGSNQDGLGGEHFIWVDMRCHPLERGNAMRSQCEVVATMRDVTDRKRQEMALQDACAEAERANAAKSRFLATMSHELRTPLNAIIGFSDMLAKEHDQRLDAQRRREYATLINESGNHLLSMVNGILDVSRLETGDPDIAPERFAPATVIASCCELLALKARDTEIEIVVRAGENLPHAVADKRAFKQILINLVSNAVKFTNRGGRVTVSARCEGALLAVTIEDNGVGISSDDLSRVGQPFFQARATRDRRHDGSGLGLSIVKRLVMLHGGQVDIASRVGEGTCVTVRLPLDGHGARQVREKSQLVPARLPFERALDATQSLVKKSA